MIRAAVVGATGYTGLEIIKILCNHPDAELNTLTAKIDLPKIYIDDEFPSLKGKCHKICHNFSLDIIPGNTDVVFLAVPHTVAIKLAPPLLKKGMKVIDLSADFRIKDPLLYQKWYKTKHTETGLLKTAVYGLPELYKNKIKKAKLIANPGCYPTGIILGIAPVSGKIKTLPVYINSLTGASGAGRKASLPLLVSECVNNIRPYKVLSHQHQPEIEQELTNLAGSKINISFVPNLAPLERGIISTIFIKLKETIPTGSAIDSYRQYYKNSPFVHVLSEGHFPELKNVIHTNNCHIGLKIVKNELVVITAIDNLGKGAASQAVQNMNIMFGFPEDKGLI